MFISSINNAPWQELEAKTSSEGILLKIAEERQKIRGFGTAFSELGAVALSHLSATASA